MRYKHCDIFLGDRFVTLPFWRKWHRWIAFPASIFLLFASATGAILAFTEFFGAEEALREATRDLVSPVSLSSPPRDWSDPLARAMATVSKTAGGAPIDKITMQFKGEQPTVTIFTGRPTGGEDRQFVVNARTGDLIRTDVYADKPFLNRVHSGEAFGDGGLVFAMLWAVALFVLTITGLIIYLKLRPRAPVGLKKVFW
jgi:uncharacterized iron-regulated membrane protein